ncbi:putative Ig domain-containing protein [Ruania alkalisoli]|uniref:Putative Ig domain-containing protein n=1 Tax=Ruania alkalisoli TaxID=2779775 RepID=A0A7M1SZ16_9MICO|nr:Ig domain-containing protein [Ruania alkalisoli]QOR71992.1 putative Ig domain-containing protein [Ruania alkalisoli]
MVSRARSLAGVRRLIAAIAAAILVCLGGVVTAPSASAVGTVVIDDFAGNSLGMRTVTLSPAMGGTQASTFTESGGVGVFSIGGQGNTQGSVRFDYTLPGPTDLTEGWTNTRISFAFDSIQRTPDDGGTALSYSLTLVDSEGGTDSISSGIASTDDFDASFPLLCEGTLCYEDVDVTRVVSATLELRAPGTYDEGHSVTVRMEGVEAAPPVGTPTEPLTPTVTTPTTTIAASAPTSVQFTVSFASDGFLEGTTALEASDLTVSGTAAGRDNVQVSGGPSVYQVLVGPLTSDGTVSVGVPADVVTGLASRPNIASSDEPVVTFDLGAVPAITSGDTATFIAGEAGSFEVVATGDPVPDVTITGGLPAGLTLSDLGSGTVAITGTPEAATGGTYPVTVTASNGYTPNAVQELSVTVNEAPAFTSADAVTFTAGEVGGFTVEVSAGFPGPVTVGAESVLPEGLSLVDHGDGSATLSGTPVAGGVSVLELVASNGAGLSAQQSLSVTVNEAPAFTSADAVTFTAGEVGGFTVEVSAGFPGPVTVGAESVLPEGLSLVDHGDGSATLSGTPVAGGVSVLELVASNGAGLSAQQQLTLTIQQSPELLTEPSLVLVAGVQGALVLESVPGFPPETTLTLTGDLPLGVTFTDHGDGTATLAGVAGPDAVGQYPITVTASNGAAPDAVRVGTVTVELAAAVTLPEDEPVATGQLSGLPAQTTVGQEVTVTGTGFAAGAPVSLGMYSEPTVLGSAAADAAGEFTATFVIPDQLGDHTIVAAGVSAAGEVQYLTAPTEIVLEPVEEPTDDGPSLPSTGAAVGGVLILAIAVVGLGAFLSRQARHRQV